MEKAILQTLIYADIFDYPLKAWEIHKWLIGSKCDLPDVEKGLKRLLVKKRIIERYGYFILPGKSKNIRKRIDKERTSQEHMHSARWIVRLFKLVPWIQLVGISGNLAMDNADEYDDIDLFVITQKKRLWISRLSILFILSLLEKRRRRSDSRKSAAGKFCLNLLLEEDQLEQTRKDLYIAHEVLQMRPIWERNNIYSIFLNQNSWAFDYLSNWLTGFQGYSGTKKKNSSGFKLTDLIETVVSFLQLRYMGVPKSAERVSAMAVYFHPDDMQPKVLSEYAKRIKKYIK